MKRARTWLLGRLEVLEAAGRLEVRAARASARILGRFAPDAGEIAGGLLVAYGLSLIYQPLGMIAAGLGLIAYVHGGPDNAETN